jgi:hypothetical protein
MEPSGEAADRARRRGPGIDFQRIAGLNLCIDTYMSEDLNTNNEALAAYRQRVQAFIETRDDVDKRPGGMEIDMPDLIGFKGEVHPPITEDWCGFSSDPTSRDYVTPNTILMNNSVNFPDEMDLFIDNPGTLEECSAKAADHLKAHVAPKHAGQHEGHPAEFLADIPVEELLEPMQRAVNALREPLRTLAINCLYLDATPEEAARSFGLSVEAVSFLLDVAQDQLALALRR